MTTTNRVSSASVLQPAQPSEQRSLRILRVLIDRVHQPVDVAWLAAFRILFGMAMSFSMLRFLGYGWIDRQFSARAFQFKYWGFAWVTPLDSFGMHALFATLAVLSAAMALGLYFRVAAMIFAFGFAYLQLIDVTNYLNHYYLAALMAFLLLLSPAHRAWSIDAWRTKRRVSHVPQSWLWLFRVQVGVVYTFAGLAKAQSDWLLHGQPLRIWLSSRTDMPLLGPLFYYDWTPLVMAWAGFLFDSTIVWWLLWRRTRMLAYAVVVVFHVVTRLLFPIGMFPVIMVMGALVFFPPNWPRRPLALVRGWLSPRRPLRSAVKAENEAESQPAACTPRWRAPVILAAGLYCLFQVLWPLRCFAYGGNVLWHEQGMRFSWRVMVREKNGSVTFHVRSRKNKRHWQVSPISYLTRLQEREMSSQPDLILQMAHHIRDDFNRRGVGPVEVRAEAWVSLNGRAARPFIDEQADLAAISDSLAPAWWVLPAPVSPPPHLKPLQARL